MNIQNFLSTLDGRWLTQQTALNIYLGKNTTNKCEVTYKYISHIEPSLVSSFDKQQYSSMDILEILWGNRSLDLSSSILQVGPSMLSFDHNATSWEILGWQEPGMNLRLIWLISGKCHSR